MQVEVWQWIIFNCRLFFLSILFIHLTICTFHCMYHSLQLNLSFSESMHDLLLLARLRRDGGPTYTGKKWLGREVRSIWKHSEISFSSLHHLSVALRGGSGFEKPAISCHERPRESRLSHLSHCHKVDATSEHLSDCTPPEGCVHANHTQRGGGKHRSLRLLSGSRCAYPPAPHS